jgi:hypothetical protein
MQIKAMPIVDENNELGDIFFVTKDAFNLLEDIRFYKTLYILYDEINKPGFKASSLLGVKINVDKTVAKNKIIIDKDKPKEDGPPDVVLTTKDVGALVRIEFGVSAGAWDE